MLKKILLTSIALALCLSANSNLNEKISCSEEYEVCIATCESIESYEKNILCMEKCETQYDECQSLETNDEILNDDENKDIDESENESN